MNSHPYVELMRHYLSGKLSVIEFSRAYQKQYDADKNRTSELVRTWPVRYDLQLQAEFAKGKISKEEFAARWNTLFGISDRDLVVENAISRVYSAADSVGHPDPRIAITDVELRGILSEAIRSIGRK